MGLYLPPFVARKYAEEREAHRADLLRALEATAGQLAYWNKRLREIDPHLQLVKAHSNTTLPGLKPGYFHIIRDNGQAPPTVWPLEGPNGEFREPDSGMLEDLARGDMWSERSQREREKAISAAKAAAQREREREREERLEELKDRMKAAWNPGVLIKKGLPE